MQLKTELFTFFLTQLVLTVSSFQLTNPILQRDYLLDQSLFILYSCYFWWDNNNRITKFDYKQKNVYGVLGIRTWDRRMEDANESTEQWWPPSYNKTYSVSISPSSICQFDGSVNTLTLSKKSLSNAINRNSLSISVSISSLSILLYLFVLFGFLFLFLYSNLAYTAPICLFYFDFSSLVLCTTLPIFLSISSILAFNLSISFFYLGSLPFFVLFQILISSSLYYLAYLYIS